VSLNFRGEFELFEASHKVAEFRKDLLKAVSGVSLSFEPSVVKEMRDIVARFSSSLDDAEFLKVLFERIGNRVRDEGFWKDLSAADEVLVSVQLRIRDLLAREEPLTPAVEYRDLYERITSRLNEAVGPTEVRNRKARHNAIFATLQINPGLYVAELYNRLVGGGTIRTTYTTLWTDVRWLQVREQLITVGGPQGSPRYCFPHPNAIQDRRDFYNRFFCTEGIIDKNLTESFSMRKHWFEAYRVNSMTKALILLLEHGAVKGEVVGQRVKSFGRLHNFESAQRSHGLDPKPGVKPADVLRAINVTQISNGKEVTMWHERPHGGPLSLYSS